MYHQHFGLQSNPFRPTPSTEFFFASGSHREALAALQWGLSDPTGLVLLSGDVGTGKTTVIRELFSRETGGIRIALLENPKLPFDQLLQSILHQLGEAVPEGRARMLEALTEAAKRHRVVVVIDEAQQLSDEGLEEFRLLSNSSPERLQLMLAGQPELLERLSSPNLRQLNQRIAIRAVLSPLGLAETVDYLRHRLRAAGGDAGRIFTRRALRSLARTSRGIPRRINILAHNAMLFAYSSGAQRVRPRHVVAATLECDHPSVPLADASQPLRGQSWRGAVVAAVLVIATIGLASGAWYRGGSRAKAAQLPSQGRSTSLAAPIDRFLDPPAFGAAFSYHLEEPAIGSPAPSPSVGPASVPPSPRTVKVAARTSAQREALPEAEPVEHHADRALTAMRQDSYLPTSVSEPSNEVVVQVGDTLSGIAERYGDLDVKQLVEANPEIKDANLIYPGERVRLSANESTSEGAP